MRFRFCGDLDCPDWMLAEINTLSDMSAMRLKVIVNQILNFCIAGEMNYEKILKVATDNADGINDLKGAIASVHFLLTSAAKYDVDDRVLIQEVQQLGLPKENSETICRQYREAKDMLRDKFEESSYRISRLVAADWRVDQVLASSSIATSPLGAERVVHLNLNVDTNPNHSNSTYDRYRDVSFTLPAEQLNLLVHELTQAQQMMNNLQ